MSRVPELSAKAAIRLGDLRADNVEEWLEGEVPLPLTPALETLRSWGVEPFQIKRSRLLLWRLDPRRIEKDVRRVAPSGASEESIQLTMSVLAEIVGYESDEDGFQPLTYRARLLLAVTKALRTYWSLQGGGFHGHGSPAFKSHHTAESGPPRGLGRIEDHGSAEGEWEGGAAFADSQLAQASLDFLPDEDDEARMRAYVREQARRELERQDADKTHEERSQVFKVTKETTRDERAISKLLDMPLRRVRQHLRALRRAGLL